MSTTFEPQPGRGGLPFVRLVAEGGATADVYLHGAHVATWTPAGEAESRLFLSDRAVFADGKAIRGGIPVVFPQFSDIGPFVRHGFARTSAWALEEAGRDGDAAFARLSLSDTEATRALWPHAFRLELTVRVDGRTLSVRLAVQNTDDAPFDFTAALHTYFAADTLATKVVGLDGTSYRDTSDGGTVKTEREAAIRFDGGEIDRVYIAAPATLALEGGRSLAVEQDGFEDTVVWNPGREKGDEIGDLVPGDAARFVCVEAAQVVCPVVLRPGETWVGEQRLTAR